MTISLNDKIRASYASRGGKALQRGLLSDEALLPTRDDDPSIWAALYRVAQELDARVTELEAQVNP